MFSYIFAPISLYHISLCPTISLCCLNFLLFFRFLIPLSCIAMELIRPERSTICPCIAVLPLYLCHRVTLSLDPFVPIFPSISSYFSLPHPTPSPPSSGSGPRGPLLSPPVPLPLTYFIPMSLCPFVPLFPPFSSLFPPSFSLPHPTPSPPSSGSGPRGPSSVSASLYSPIIKSITPPSLTPILQTPPIIQVNNLCHQRHQRHCYHHHQNTFGFVDKQYS